MRLYDYKQIRLWWTLSNDDNEFFTCMQKILDNDELMAVCFFIDCVNIRNDSYPCYIDKFNKEVQDSDNDFERECTKEIVRLIKLLPDKSAKKLIKKYFE